MNRRETPPGAPHPPISSGLSFSSHQLTVGQPEPLVKPASEAAHQPGQQPAAFSCLWCGDDIPADLPDDDYCSDACHWESMEQAQDDW